MAFGSTLDQALERHHPALPPARAERAHDQDLPFRSAPIGLTVEDIMPRLARRAYDAATVLPARAAIAGDRVVLWMSS